MGLRVAEIVENCLRPIICNMRFLDSAFLAGFSIEPYLASSIRLKSAFSLPKITQ